MKDTFLKSECLHRMELGVIEAFFFCLTCCSFYDKVSTFAEILLLQPHLYRSYVIQTERNESAATCVGRLNQRGQAREQMIGCTNYDILNVSYILSPIKSWDHTHATAGISANCGYSYFRGRDKQMFSKAALCTSASTHTNPSLLLHKTPPIS